jgi:phosphocarrier protein
VFFDLFVAFVVQDRMTTRSVAVTNQLGLHARAAARFVHLATRFESQIRVGRNARVMDGKSIMGILLLAAARGTTITISADGADEDAAVGALAQLVESGFGEDPAASAGPAKGGTWNA